MDLQPDLHNVELEQALLGALLVDQGHANRIKSLRAEHFSEPVHQRVFEEIMRAMDAGETPTPLTLKHRFDNDEVLHDIGGGQYLGRLAASSLAIMDARDCEREIISLWRARKMRDAWSQGLYQLGKTPAEEVAAEVNTITHKILSDSDCSKIRSNYDIAVEIIEDMKLNRPYFSTGLAKLDSAMGGGLYPGMSYGFGGRKKIGKTMIASTISCNLNTAQVPHLFICGEMSAKEVHQRTLARMAGQYLSGFRAREKSDAFQQAIADAAVRAPRCAFYLDAPGITFEHLRRSCSSALSKGIKGFILDYWQLVGGKEPRANTAEHLDEVAQWVASFCRKHQVWAIVMAQINQEGNTRGGEGLRLACDQMYQIHRIGEKSTNYWLEMLETRYTAWVDVGSESAPALQLNPRGPFFEEFTGWQDQQ